MSAVFVPVRPGLRFGRRPETTPACPVSPLENRLQARLKTRRRTSVAFASILARVRGTAEELRRAYAIERARLRRELGERASGDVVDDALVVDAFAHALLDVEALFDVTLHDGQLEAGWAMLHGSLVEMGTGEGKTLAAALPAIVVGLSGTPVHVLTANAYLAARDAAALAPLYARFGLDVAHADERDDDATRAAAYRRDIVYASARQIAFDHLLDTREPAPPPGGVGERFASLLASPAREKRLRGLCFAIVDEADDVLVDEARTPLVLSAPVGDEDASRSQAAVALALARALHEGVDYALDTDARAVRLTPEGVEAVRLQTRRLDGAWRLDHHRDALVRQALSALHLFRRDRDYLVRDERVVLIDESSGRPQPDRRLRDGLHRLVELKERCPPTPDTEVVAATSFPRLLTRYHRLCGTSGTLREARAELREVYRLAVTCVSPHRPSRLTRWPDSVVPDREAQMTRLLERIASCRESGRPVLVGTRTLALSERIAARLDAAGIPHRLLNARQDAEEAAVVAAAGTSGAVTIATNMAGRGADIPLDHRARAAGGLHVIGVELNDSGRVDRQLFGRAARQGDPGSCERLLSLDDETLAASVAPVAIACVRRLAGDDPARATRLGRSLFAVARRRLERRDAHLRKTLFHRTEHELRRLAVTGSR